MLIIGERINTSRPEIKKAVRERDEKFILNEARKQIEAGALMIDVNCGTELDTELEDMKWVIETLRKDGIRDICLDSPSPLILKEALAFHKGKAMINSITAEKSRYEKILPVCKDYNCDIIALTMDEKGMPKTAQDRFEIATIIMEICNRYKISKEKLYVDPLVRPASTEPEQVKEFLHAITLIKDLGIKTIAGLSNVSFGLPKRKMINKVFFTMAISYGLDACLIDPLDKGITSALKTSQVLLGEDEYCASFLKAYREGTLV